VDGYIARKLSCITKLGQFLDPLVDKLLINTYFLFFSLKNLISPLFLIFFLIRDLIIESIRSYLLLKKNITLPADKIGKVKTFLQMLIIFLILLSPFFNNFLFLFLNDEIKISKILLIFFNIFLANILFLSFYSGYFYFKKFIILLKEKIN
jgi:CDP-diacylglycerol---glycerol-3-phosphate 3-phosphatidyltransferase